MATEVSICSNALVMLGGKPITSLTDGTTNANLSLQFYAETRDELLRSHPWRMAIGRVALAQDALYVASWEWSYGFALPTDSLRILKTDIDPEPWAREGKWLVCNSEAVSVKYIKQITDPTAFDASFVTALEAALAVKLCKPVTGSLQTLGNAVALRDAAIREAKTNSAFEGTAEVSETHDLINCR